MSYHSWDNAVRHCAVQRCAGAYRLPEPLSLLGNPSSSSSSSPLSTTHPPPSSPGMPLTVIALGRVKHGAEAELPQVLKTMAAKSVQEPGLLTYIVHISVEDPKEFAVYEIYEDAAALDAHLKGEPFAELLKFMKPNLDGELEIKKLNAL